jgi:hypothetical protein
LLAGFQVSLFMHALKRLTGMLDVRRRWTELQKILLPQGFSAARIASLEPFFTQASWKSFLQAVPADWRFVLGFFVFFFSARGSLSVLQ